MIDRPVMKSREVKTCDTGSNRNQNADLFRDRARGYNEPKTASSGRAGVSAGGFGEARSTWLQAHSRERSGGIACFTKHATRPNDPTRASFDIDRTTPGTDQRFGEHVRASISGPRRMDVATPAFARDDAADFEFAARGAADRPIG